MDVGKTYEIIYDDKGRKPVRKRGRVEYIKDGLFKLDSNSEELNIALIIRTKPVDGENCGEQKKYS